ncbi:hypothetical protein GCM10011390_19230 [Aureimonas endophytica]|uniref:Uncharacterized protein n=1 Tax=Aureimonas endophytica TaxID=2027858 RepID=A0A916ZJ66_9HYPH|nr:hypothetical protein [Aureimonas endophytica]GGE00583.1 hypothetical protein GCM10011390_19230 [Aureimonas endophytica]
MRIALATLLLVSTTPIAAHAEPDRYSGRYSAECGDLVCELDIVPRSGGWTIRWTATDPTVLDAVPACSFTTTAELGSAVMGPAGVVSGIAVGEWKGRPFGIFDLEPGRVSWSSSWEACPGVAPKRIYEAYGDE